MNGDFDSVGQIEAAFGLDDVGEQAEDGFVLLNQLELDRGLVSLEVLFAHGPMVSELTGSSPGSAQPRTTRRSLILAALP